MAERTDMTPPAPPALTAAEIARIREVYPLDRKPCAWCNSRKSHHYDCPVPDIHRLLAALAAPPSAWDSNDTCRPHGGDGLPGPTCRICNPPVKAAPPPDAGLVALVREWQEARKPMPLPAPGENLAETYQAAVRRMAAADEALARFDLNGPAGGALGGQSVPPESTGTSLRDELAEIIRWRFKSADGKPLDGAGTALALEESADALEAAALPAPARPTAEQIALVETLVRGSRMRQSDSLHAAAMHWTTAKAPGIDCRKADFYAGQAERSEREAADAGKLADALTALLTAVTGKDTP